MINLEIQHDGKGFGNLDEKCTTLNRCGGLKRGLLGAPKTDFVTLRNESTLMMNVWRFPQRLSIDPNIFVGVEASECPSTESLWRNAVLYCSPLLRQ